MFYPDVPLEYWVKKHDFKVKKLKCLNCGLIQKTTIPFLSKESIGLVTPVHDCGPEFQRWTGVIKDKSNRNKWARLVDRFIKKE